jgi:hypothetical protein
MPRIEIMSDGTPETTRVFIDGKRLDTIQRITFKAGLYSVSCSIQRVMVDENGSIVSEGHVAQIEKVKVF